MLFMDDSARDKIGQVCQRYQAGEIAVEDASRRLLEIDPEYGVAHFLSGCAYLDQGRYEEAERELWHAIESFPVHGASYVALASVRDHLRPGDELAKELHNLGFRALGASREVSDAVVDLLGRAVPENSGIDLHDPFVFQVLAQISERNAGASISEEVRERMLPYRLLLEAAGEVDSGIADETLEAIRENAARCMPVFLAALRQWGRENKSLSVRPLAMILALIGEFAGPEALEDVIEIAIYADPEVFRHANWAVARIAERFPEKALDVFARAAGTARVALRCCLAEHIAFLPRSQRGVEVALDLLSGFERLAKDPDAELLLMAVCCALEQHSGEQHAAQVIREYLSVLPRPAQKRCRKAMASDEGYIPRLIEEEIEGWSVEEVCQEQVLLEDEDEDEEDDDFEEEPDEYEDEEEAGPPAIRPERNDPCWCGSGKKYKKCHMTADEQSTRAAGPQMHRSLARRDDVLKLLTDEAKRPERSPDMEHAERTFFGGSDGMLQDEDIDTFFDWYLHDFRSPRSGSTFADHCLQTRKLAPRERELLEAWRDARFGLYEVNDIERGRGIELRDVCSEETFFVHDVSSSKELVQWDCLLARIDQLEGRWEFSANGTIVPRGLLSGLLERIESERRPDETSREFVAANSHRLPRMVQEMADEGFAGLQARNNDGDPIEFCSALYETGRVGDVIGTLRGTGALTEEPADEGSDAARFRWLEPGKQTQRTVYGQVEIRGGRLKLSCNSRRRLEQGRKLIEDAAGEHLRHLGDSFESFEAIKKRAAAQPVAMERDSGLPPGVEREIVLKYKQEHYAKWPDVPLPALGGRTPREAVATAEGRQNVIELLRTIENGEERERRKGRPAHDFAEVRSALGLEDD